MKAYITTMFVSARESRMLLKTETGVTLVSKTVATGNESDAEIARQALMATAKRMKLEIIPEPK